MIPIYNLLSWTGTTLSVKKTHHFFRATLTKIRHIKTNHICTQISFNIPYQAHLNFESKWRKCSEITRGHFSKITETTRLLGPEFATDKSRCSGYITRHWNWMNNYWMFWIGSLSWRFPASSFWDFWKITFCDFTLPFAISHFSPFWQKQPFDFSDVLHKEYFSLSLSKGD